MKRIGINVRLLVALLLLSPCRATGQSGSIAPPAVVVPAADLSVAGPGTLLRIAVAGHAQLDGTYRVDPAGMLQLPGLSPLAVNGLSLAAVSQRIAAQFANESAKRLAVRVQFDRGLHSVFVAGEVRAPGLITMKGPLSLMKVLARAGSRTPAAGDVLVVIHDEFSIEGDGPKTAEARTRIDIKNLQPGHDVQLHDGDTVFVPKAQQFYVLGEVRRPGVYLLTPGMTVLQAIALAGGLSEHGSDRGVKVLRSIDGETEEIDADGSRVVQANDTVHVRARRF